MTFKIFNVKINISFLFAVSLCIILANQFNENLALVFLFSLIHEMSHLCVLMLFGEKPREIHVGIFGIEIIRGGNLRLSYFQECLTAMAGPLINLLLALFIFFTALIFKNPFPVNPITVNLSLALLNLLPIYPLDGGRGLHYYLCEKYPQEKALRISDRVALICLFPLAFLGFTILIRSGYNYTLLAICAYLCMLFLFRNNIY